MAYQRATKRRGNKMEKHNINTDAFSVYVIFNKDKLKGTFGEVESDIRIVAWSEEEAHKHLCFWDGSAATAIMMERGLCAGFDAVEPLSELERASLVEELELEANEEEGDE